MPAKLINESGPVPLSVTVECTECGQIGFGPKGRKIWYWNRKRAQEIADAHNERWCKARNPSRATELFG